VRGGAAGVEDVLEVSSLVDAACERDGVGDVGEDVKDGVGWGRIPAIIQSSLKNAVISTRKGGRLAVAAVVVTRGLARMRATLMWSAQAIRRVESSCQCKVHLKRSARGLSTGRSMYVMRVWETQSYILTP